MFDMPDPPDPYETANAQAGANRDAVIAANYLNNMKETNPYGSVSYKDIGEKTYTDSQGKEVTVPVRERIVELSADQQKLLEGQNKAKGGLLDLGNSQIARLQGVLSSPIDMSGIPERQFNVPGQTLTTDFGNPDRMMRAIADAGPVQRSIGPQDWSADRVKVEEAIYSRLNPQLERDRAALETRLTNQGLVRGSEAFDTAMKEQGQKENDARMAAVLAGGQEQSRLANLDLAQGTFANTAQAQEFGQNATRTAAYNTGVQGDNASGLAFRTAENAARVQQQGLDTARIAAENAARDSAIQENLALRNQPINEITALLGGSQVTVPQFAAPYQQSVPPVPIADYIYQNYQAQAQNAQAGMSGLFGLGSSFLGALGKAGGLFALSDRRAKTDIKRVGETDEGLPVYTYKYKGDSRTQMGVMAQDVKKTRPDAVAKTPSGLFAVDYSKVA